MNQVSERVRLKRFVLRWLVNGIGLWAAAQLIDGIDYGNDVSALILAALIFSLINSIIKPLVVVFALPAIVITLGLFLLVVNGLMLYLTSALYPPFEISSFGSAVLAAIIVGVVNYALSLFVDGTDKPPIPRRKRDDEVIDLDE